MESEYARFLVLAGLVYTLVEFVKPVYDPGKKKWNFDVIAALVVGIGVSFLAKFDIFATSLVNLPLSVPYIGNILTGILAGGAVGAGFIHGIPDWVLKLFNRTPAP